ncbi:unnamed protein product [Closterium sp. NIES-64]|nr:unnamed protein product [Closterium sp. NIES-64]
MPRRNTPAYYFRAGAGAGRRKWHVGLIGLGADSIGLQLRALESGAGEWRWRVALESGAGEWRWRVALESGAGEWRWRVALESGAGEWRWRVALEGGAGEWRWRVTLESGAGEWRWRVTLQHWLAASESYPQLGGLLSQDSATNPLFHGWNLVWVVYCDGGAYSSTRGRADLGEGTSVYMQGRQILDDIITGGQQIVDHLTTDLCTQRGMGAALHVLYSGSSAGGHAIIMHCDRLAAAFPHAKATCLANSGFFVDAKDRFGVYSWRESIQQLTALHLIEVPKCPAGSPFLSSFLSQSGAQARDY